MSAPKGNQYASKPPQDKAEAHTHIRSTTQERQSWLRASAGKGLTKWIRSVLNRAAGLDDSRRHQDEGQ